MFKLILDCLDSLPSIQSWLRRDSWRGDFKAADFAHISLSGVCAVIYHTHTKRPESLSFTAHVREFNGKIYKSQIELELVTFPGNATPEVEFLTTCDCRKSVKCKHAASAMSLLMKDLIATQKKAAAQTPKALPLPDTSSGALEIAQWFEQLIVHQKPHTVQQLASQPANPQKFYAYCITLPQTREKYGSIYPVFSVHLATFKLGDYSYANKHTLPSLDIPDSFLTKEDLMINMLVRSQIRKSGMSNNGINIIAQDWLEIFTRALAIDRLFLRHAYSNGYVSHRRLVQAPPVDVKLGWKSLPTGSTQPILTFSQKHVRPILCDPPVYINPETFEFGLLNSEFSYRMLETWRIGPAIAPQYEQKVAEKITLSLPHDKVPTPKVIDTINIQGKKPTATLHITQVLFGLYRIPRILAYPVFHYENNISLPPRESPHSSDLHACLRAGKRVVLKRDVFTENEAIQHLNDARLRPILPEVSPSELSDKNRHAYITESQNLRSHQFNNDTLVWSEVVFSPKFQTLADCGWQVTIDPGLGLTVHDVDDFFPEIESDTTHGIDWFRFDVSGEFNGKKISLLPQIAKAIQEDWRTRYADPATRPEHLLLPCEKPSDGFVRFPADRFLKMLDSVHHLISLDPKGGSGPLRVDRLAAAAVADALQIASCETTRALAELGRNLREINGLPEVPQPSTVIAELRPYQQEGFRWLQFLAHNSLHGVLADDMGLGKTLQTLTHLATEHAKNSNLPSLIVAPTSVVPNWLAETEKFTPSLKVLRLQGAERGDHFEKIPQSDLVITSYPLLVRDFQVISSQPWNTVVLDEAQFIKNAKAQTTLCACRLKAAHRICLSGTPMENHLGELWSLMRFLMPGFLADEKSFNTHIRRPIERDQNRDMQIALNRRVAPLILRRTKDQVAKDLPEKTSIIHHIDLHPRQQDLYESIRALMDKRVREAISSKGLAQSHIIVLDALLKLRQICCHPHLLNIEQAKRVQESAKLDFLSGELLPQLIEEGRRILLFSQFTSMLALIEEHLKLESIPYLLLTGQTKERAKLVKEFQKGETPVFLISLKAGGTGLNLTAADTVIHYDPWWNPAAENQATDRAHRIGQTKPVFVHKLVCRGTIEDRILELQKHKANLVEALLSEETTKLKIDENTLSHLFTPIST